MLFLNEVYRHLGQDLCNEWTSIMYAAANIKKALQNGETARAECLLTYARLDLSKLLFKSNRDAAIAWLTKLARREITLNSAGAPVAGKGGPRVASSTARGWGDLPVR